jgi:hypothetical protein
MCKAERPDWLIVTKDIGVSFERNGQRLLKLGEVLGERGTKKRRTKG